MPLGAVGWGAVAAAVTPSVVGAISGSNSGQQAAGGANKGAAMDQRTWGQLQGYQQPWQTSGAYAQNDLNMRLGIGTPGGGSNYGSLMRGYGQNLPGNFSYTGQGAPGQFNPTAYQPFTIQDFHQMSPAYAFQKQQGMQGVLNTDGANSGALSGAAQKDLIGYNQGMANTAFNNAFQQNMQGQQQRYAQQLGQFQGNLSSYNSQFGNQLAGYQQDLARQQQGFGQFNTQNQNIYSRLLGVSGLGQQSAGQLGQEGTALSTDTAQGYTNAGVANAWGTMNTGNSLAGGAASLANANVPWGNVFGGGGTQDPGWTDNNPWEMS